MISSDTQAFILQHRYDDVRQLALSPGNIAAADLPFALDQIQGWQTARHKLPSWAETEGIVFPPHLNMEQCSSEATALYKQQLLSELIGADLPRATLADLTGGFGVDFSFMSRGFRKAYYIERDAHLCDLARHNFQVLSMPQAKVVCDDGVEWLHRFQKTQEPHSPTIIYLDPARRDLHGQKVFGLTDCTPDVTQICQELLSKASCVVVKLSPMLDHHAAIEALTTDGKGAEVHIVAVANECKELLLVLTHRDTPLKVVCSNDNETFAYTPSHIDADTLSHPRPLPAEQIAGTLLVPNACIMKAGCFAELCAAFAIRPLDSNSHLFVSASPVGRFPGRQFQIQAISSMNKKDLKHHLAGLTQANIAVRNFPLSVAQLRKRLKLKDGGNHYIFATTWQGRHVLIIATK